ncbi:hypothetical protein [Synechococcus sp. MIT S9220]
MMHSIFGEGELTHIFGSSEKLSIAIKFPGTGAKIGSNQTISGLNC